MFLKKATMATLFATAAMTVAPSAQAQHVEGDARSPVVQWGRMMAEPGTFWLDSMDDREVIRYTTARDVSLCLPRPDGVAAADKGYPIQVTWDGTNTATLYPGNCLYFDAKRVSLKPARALEPGVTLTGKVQTAGALRH
ncbi:hypothetical protein [Croceicoccus bisphenolivorans]|uniref:hypothetical protein n=1 Tax=Croceicoccus bisphenolivorans TaxID=1783232 RepID=UPI000A5F13A9|nr:hypothetical protein [Croceicoccus bisphenolivorans]